MSIRHEKHETSEIRSLCAVLRAAEKPTTLRVSEQIGNEAIDNYVMENIMHFILDRNLEPGDRVLERDKGRIGTVQYMRWDLTIPHPAVLYDDDPEVDSSYNVHHFLLIKPGARLPPLPKLD